MTICWDRTVNQCARWAQVHTTVKVIINFSIGLPSTGEVRGALRGGVKAPPVGVARRRRAAAAAVTAAAPFSPPHVSAATATWLSVPLCALAAMESAGVPGVDASPSAPPALKARVLHARDWNLYNRTWVRLSWHPTRRTGWLSLGGDRRGDRRTVSCPPRDDKLEYAELFLEGDRWGDRSGCGGTALVRGADSTSTWRTREV